MRSPFIGRGIAIALIVAFVAWTAVRSIGARPIEPRFPFPKPAADEPLASAKGEEKVVLAGGCFWGVQAVFEHTKGVTSAVAGYAGGHVESPGYEMVSSGRTGPDGVFLGGPRPHAVEPSGTRQRIAVSLRDFLHQRGTEAHRHDVRRTAERREILSHQNRYANRAVHRLLPRRGISPGLSEQPPRRALYRVQRPAEAGEPEKTGPRTLPRKLSFATAEAQSEVLFTLLLKKRLLSGNALLRVRTLG